MYKIVITINEGKTIKVDKKTSAVDMNIQLDEFDILSSENEKQVAEILKKKLGADEGLQIEFQNYKTSEEKAEALLKLMNKLI